MKRIIICCDGTWNTRDQRYPTNVVKLHEALLPQAPDGRVQDRYYQRGVGTPSPVERPLGGGRGAWLVIRLAMVIRAFTWVFDWLVERIPGGIFGTGLWKNVQEAYRHIVDTYEAGDELFFFGFSRGAFTVRSTVGMIRKCGILRRDRRELIKEAYDRYRNRRLRPDAPEMKVFRSENSVRFGDRLFADVPPVKFVGVWDTVGALGIPVGLIGRIWNRRHRFHNVSLSRIVENAYHALAIDEKRRSFRPTLWEQHPDAKDQKLEQRWFAGVHTNIGGGGSDSRQSDWTLRWIIAKARECGLAFDEHHIESHIENEPHGGIREFRKWFWRWLPSLCRPIGKGVPPKEATYLGGISHETVDPLVIDRNIRDPSYMPPNLVAYFRENPRALEVAKERPVMPAAPRPGGPAAG